MTTSRKTAPAAAPEPAPAAAPEPAPARPVGPTDPIDSFEIVASDGSEVNSRFGAANKQLTETFKAPSSVEESVLVEGFKMENYQ